MCPLALSLKPQPLASMHTVMSLALVQDFRHIKEQIPLEHPLVLRYPTRFLNRENRGDV